MRHQLLLNLLWKDFEQMENIDHSIKDLRADLLKNKLRRYLYSSPPLINFDKRKKKIRVNVLDYFDPKNIKDPELKEAVKRMENEFAKIDAEAYLDFYEALRETSLKSRNITKRKNKKQRKK
ncbi:MAG: hypothetical protein IH934_00120 [Nanoarchaeota archaeon]|nr:hypothetical protein [Nanoarchaeota archaeon]